MGNSVLWKLLLFVVYTQSDDLKTYLVFYHNFFECMEVKNVSLLHLHICGGIKYDFQNSENTRNYFYKIKYLLYKKKLFHWNIDLNLSIWYQWLVFGYITTHSTLQTNTLGHLVIKTTQGMGSRVIHVVAWAVLALDLNRTRPAACCHCPLNKGAVHKRFLHAIKARNLYWAGVEQGGRPEWDWSLLEPV